MAGTATPRRNRRVEDPKHTDDTESFAEKAAVYATRPIRTEDEYDHAREIIARLLREPHPEGSFAYDVLEVLSILVEDYEEKNVPVLAEATPQEIVQFMSEQRGMTQGDLAEILGGRSRLSEFMNRKRDLSIGQVRSLRDELGIPADLLIA
ncbi:MAG: transcriptional regulator [Gemmatimonadetes bacterium]|nr:MAG: transcriptional regulator [Gemmatimonadota bacterium]PYO80096.1 MAG: transcriptional regulator [Gemmatimonadota bacterium]